MEEQEILKAETEKQQSIQVKSLLTVTTRSRIKCCSTQNRISKTSSISTKFKENRTINCSIKRLELQKAMLEQLQPGMQ
jgi:hypothetical protein